MRDMKAKVGNAGVELCTDDAKWTVNTILFADDTVLAAENQRDLQKMVKEFTTVCQRRRLKVNVKKRKVMDFEWEGLTLCKHLSMEEEVREKSLQGRKVVGSLGRMMKGRPVNMEIKKALRDCIMVPTLPYTSDTWRSNEGQRSRIKAVEMSYLRGTCGLNRMDGEGNESVYGKVGMFY